MSSRDLFFYFLETIFIIFLIAFSLFFFILGDRFYLIYVFMRAVAPLAVYALFFLAVTEARRREMKKRKREERMDIVLLLDFWDKAKADFITFGLATAIFVIPFLTKGRPDIIDVFQASVVLVILFLWHRYLFSKEES